jgi:hypothetical protein
MGLSYEEYISLEVTNKTILTSFNCFNQNPYCCSDRITNYTHSLDTTTIISCLLR